MFLIALTGCGMFSKLDEVVPDNTKKYRKAQTMPPLDVPPDLSAEQINEDIVGNKSIATYLEFEEASTNPLAIKYNIDLDTKPMLSGKGEDRHLIVPNDLATTWQRVLAFWQQKGLDIKRKEIRIGLMDTQPESNGYSYRVRIDKGDTLARTRVHLSGTNGETSLAQKDEAMLRQIAAFLGALHQADKAKQEQTGKQQVVTAKLTLIKEADNYHALHIDQEFTTVWERIARVLDSKGFVVEDRDRAQAIYLIRYLDPNKEVAPEPGLLDKIMFWKDDVEITPEVFYYIKLIAEADKTKIIILDAEKTRSNSDTAIRLLDLIQEQLA